LAAGVTSSVSSLAVPLAGAVPFTQTTGPGALAGPPAGAARPAGLLQPLVGGVTNTADQLVGSVPVVKSIVPSGTVSAVAIPAAAVADGAVAGLVDVAVPPLVDALPLLEPVVQPVAGLVTGATPLPVVLPGVPDTLGELPGALVPDTAPAAGPAGSGPAVPEHAESAADVAAGSPGTALARTRAAAAATPGAFLRAPVPGSPGSPVAEDPAPSPAPALPAPAAPGSGAGGASPSGPSGAAAWLNDFDLDLPLSGTHSVSGASGQGPSPVSFDPGSSPD
jgi:hypothetical protein